MTDLEITKACAEAMGLKTSKYLCRNKKRRLETRLSLPRRSHKGGMTTSRYNPLHDDAQAMALVKKFGLHTGFQSFDNLWGCLAQDGITKTYNTDLNRAICECVAKMKKAKP